MAAPADRPAGVPLDQPLEALHQQILTTNAVERIAAATERIADALEGVASLTTAAWLNRRDRSQPFTPRRDRSRSPRHPQSQSAAAAWLNQTPVAVHGDRSPRHPQSQSPVAVHAGTTGVAVRDSPSRSPSQVPSRSPSTGQAQSQSTSPSAVRDIIRFCGTLPDGSPHQSTDCYPAAAVADTPQTVPQTVIPQPQSTTPIAVHDSPQTAPQTQPTTPVAVHEPQSTTPQTAPQTHPLLTSHSKACSHSKTVIPQPQSTTPVAVHDSPQTVPQTVPETQLDELDDDWTATSSFHEDEQPQFSLHARENVDLPGTGRAHQVRAQEGNGNWDRFSRDAQSTLQRSKV